MAGAPSRGVWKQLDGLFRFGASGQLGDAELLGRFVAGRRDEDGEDAFAALVERHGPMVLGVCRRVLGDRHAAEDAFQATFLVLARKAGAIARREQLANWLHGVASRTALDARARADRRRARERKAFATAEAPTGPDDGPERGELRDPRRGARPAAGLVSRRGGPLRARRPVAPGGCAAARHPRGHPFQPVGAGQGVLAPSPDPAGIGPVGYRPRCHAGARNSRAHPPALAGGFHHRGRGAGRGRCFPGRGRIGLGRDPDPRSSPHHVARESQRDRLRDGRGGRRHHGRWRAGPVSRSCCPRRVRRPPRRRGEEA